ncbi:MAG: glycosyltransferase family 9 protein [Melioribacteraceae bacterium]|nr:glycosyltransferase family 9 protein [Melioribacteraceae bacterium]
MSFQNKIKKAFNSFLEKLISVNESHDWNLESTEKVLIVRQHNQFGDMLASVSLFRAFKETYPECRITLIAGSENFFAVKKNSLIDDLFIFDKRKLLNPFYSFRLKKILSRKYDAAIVPATVAVSTTSCLLTGLSKAKVKVGPNSLDGIPNKMNYAFHNRVNLNWKKNPDAHVSDFILDIVRPFGVTTKNFTSHISFDNKDLQYASDFLNKINPDRKILIGIHAGAGKPQNRWSLFSFIELINKIIKEFDAVFYFTGSRSDKEIIDFIKKYFPQEGYFLNKTIPQLAALISRSSLFITNDTGVMHVAGTTSTPQISLFGPTNPFNWAPLGENKFFIRKSELMSDISLEDVFNIAKYILDKNKI